jgi:cell wall-associated NlpC family hydrolase
MLNRSRTRQAPLLLFVLAAVVAALLVASSATADPTIASKQAQAQAILGEIQALDSDLEKAVEAYNYANVQLGQIDDDLVANAGHLKLAKRSLKVAQGHIAARLKALYINGDGGGAIEVILGAKSLDDLLSRLDVVQRVGAQDAKVLKEVKRFRKEVEERRARLRQARADQVRVVAERAASRRTVEGRLGERQRLLASVKDEIAHLQEQEARRQAALEAQARARVAAQERAAREAVLASERQAASAGSATPLEVVAPSDTGEVAAPETTYAPPPAQYGGVVGVAMSQLGTPYVWGGMSPGGFDCSGLVAWAYSQVGVSLPHHAASQYGYGTPVSRDQLEPGDLVFFDGLGHVGIYVGGGSFVHSPHTGDVVKISSLDDSWYASTWVGARRITG